MNAVDLPVAANHAAAQPGLAAEPPAERSGRTQFVRFVVVGIGSTVITLAMFAGFDLLWHNSQLANFLSLAISAVLNTAVNRAWTFGVRTAHRATTHHLQSFGVFLLTWALTSAALWAVGANWPDAGVAVKVAAILAANVFSTLARFAAMRWWIFRSPEPS